MNENEVMNNEFNDIDNSVEVETTESRGFVSTALEGCGALALIGGVGYGLYRGGKYLHRKLKDRKSKGDAEVVTVSKEELEAKKEKPSKKDKAK